MGVPPALTELLSKRTEQVKNPLRTLEHIPAILVGTAGKYLTLSSRAGSSTFFYLFMVGFFFFFFFKFI